MRILLCLLTALSAAGGQAPTGGRGLVSAAAQGDAAAVQTRISNGADPNQTDDSEVKGWTALMAAARQGHAAVVEILLRAGANPNLKNEYGATALDVARANARDAVVKVLLAAGATGRAPGTEPAPAAKPAGATAAAPAGWKISPLLSMGADVPEGGKLQSIQNPCMLDSGAVVLLAFYDRTDGKKRAAMLSWLDGKLTQLFENPGLRTYRCGRGAFYFEQDDSLHAWDGRNLRRLLTKGTGLPVAGIPGEVGRFSLEDMTSEGRAILSYQTRGNPKKEGLVADTGASLRPLPGTGDALPGIPGVTIAEQRGTSVGLQYAVFPDSVLALVKVQGAPYPKALFRIANGKADKIVAEGEASPVAPFARIDRIPSFYAATPDTFAVTVSHRESGGRKSRVTEQLLVYRRGAAPMHLDASSFKLPAEVEQNISKGSFGSSALWFKLRRVLFLSADPLRFLVVHSVEGTSLEVNALLLVDGNQVTRLAEGAPFGYPSRLYCGPVGSSQGYTIDDETRQVGEVATRVPPGICPFFSFCSQTSDLSRPASWWYYTRVHKEPRLQPIAGFGGLDGRQVDLRHLLGWRAQNQAVVYLDNHFPRPGLYLASQ